MLEMLLKHDNTVWISNLEIVVTVGLSTNMLSRNFDTHLPTNFIKQAFLGNVFLSVSTLKWNLEKSEIIMKHLCKSAYIKTNLYSSARKLLKQVYLSMNVAFMKMLVVILSFSL